MKDKKVPIAKQVYVLFALILFAFFNVFLFDNKEGIGFSVFSTLTLLTIGLLSRQNILRVLGIVSYLINVIAAWFGFNYLGWLTAVQAVELIFIVWYLYPSDIFFKNNSTNRFLNQYRWKQLLQIVAFSFIIYLGFKVASMLWDGSFLEFGGNTIFIFGIQYFLYVSLEHSRAREQARVAEMEQVHKTTLEWKEKAKELQPTPHKTVIPKLVTNTYVKFAGIWLIVMDLSILSYVIKPNDFGFSIAAFFVLLSIVISLFIQTVEDPEDVFSVIYHKIRPVQPVFFIILLIAHAHKFSYGAAYASVFALVYFIWAINKINLKTLLTLTILIYFFPVLGYISNPYRLGAKNLEQVGKIVTDTGDVEYFNLLNWLNFSNNSFDDTYEDDGVSKDDLVRATEEFYEKITVVPDEGDISSGIWNENEFDLTLGYSSVENTVTVEAYETFDELVLKDLQTVYDEMKDISPEDNNQRYRNYFLLGQVKGEYGNYRIYLQMDEVWLQKYQEDPSSVHYDVLVIGSNVSPEDVI